MCREVHPPVPINSDNPTHRKTALGQSPLEHAVDAIQVQVPPAISLGTPDESPAIRQHSEQILAAAFRRHQESLRSLIQPRPASTRLAAYTVNCHPFGTASRFKDESFLRSRRP